MKVGDMICAADFHDLCPRLSPRGSFGESCKVGIMEYGLKGTDDYSIIFIYQFIPYKPVGKYKTLDCEQQQ